MQHLKNPMGHVLVFDIETAPDPQAVAIVGRRDQIERVALHRLTGYSALSALEDADGWHIAGLNSSADREEAHLLTAISEQLETLSERGGTLISYNGIAHDNVVLRRRLMASRAFGLSGIANMADHPHVDLLRRQHGDSRGRWPALRDCCAGLGITMDHRVSDRETDPAASVIRKSQVDVMGTFMLLLHEISLDRGSSRPLVQGWCEVTRYVGGMPDAGAHLRQFMMPV